MLRPSIGGLLAIAAISLPPLVSSASAVAASPRTMSQIERQLAELKAQDTVAGDSFGTGVSISGTTLVIGAPGHAKNEGRAYVFTKTATGWAQVAKLKGSDTVANDFFGTSVAISGTTALVGAYGHANGAGRAYVFTKTAGAWKQVAELKGADIAANDFFGLPVAISGFTAVVGAYGCAKYAGRAYVFTKTAGAWKQVAELKGSDTVANDFFGDSVAISGTTAVVGASGHAKFAGRAYVFTKTAGVWKQVAELKGSDTVVNDSFGDSVAISGTTVVVGADGYAEYAGKAYVFAETAGVWKQIAELEGSDTVAGDFLGISTAVSGDMVVVGENGIGKDAGTAYLLTETEGAWRQTAKLKGSDTVGGDSFGFSVAISGTTAVVGAAGHANKAGRTYVFKV